LSIEKSDLFLREGLDHPNQLEPAQQIEIYAQAMSAGSRRGKRSVTRKNDRLICPTGKSGEERTSNARCFEF
jgi:hypothetical protein